MRLDTPSMKATSSRLRHSRGGAQSVPIALATQLSSTVFDVGTMVPLAASLVVDLPKLAASSLQLAITARRILRDSA